MFTGKTIAMAVAPESKKIQEYYYDILNHINWDLIKPNLEETKIFSQDELNSAWCKSDKARLRCLMKKITDSHNQKQFLQALKITDHDTGHQKLLEILQDIDSSGKSFVQ